MPPEIHSKKGYDAWAADVWSLGIVFFCLVTGRHPFGEPQTDKEDLKKLIIGSKIDFGQEPILPVPEDVKKMIRKMLSKQPEKRPSMSQISASACFNETKSYDEASFN